MSGLNPTRVNFTPDILHEEGQFDDNSESDSSEHSKTVSDGTGTGNKREARTSPTNVRITTSTRFYNSKELL